MKLVIAEKPSVGAAIAAVMGANEKRSGYFEGGGYLVSWCIYPVFMDAYMERAHQQPKQNPSEDCRTR